MKTSSIVLGCKLTVFALIFSLQIHAQGQGQVFTLQQCVDIALKNNINVKQRELNLNTAQADQFQSKMAALPNLNAQVNNNYNTGFAINPITNSSQRDVTFRSNNFSLNSSVTLFNGFQTTNNIKLQQKTTKSIEFDVAAAKNTLGLQVANAFMQVLLNKEIVEARMLQGAATKEQLYRQQKLYDLGASSRLKFLQVKSQYANEGSQLVQAQTLLDQAYLSLWQLMNIAPDTANKIVKPDNSQFNLDSETRTAAQIYEDFLSRSPEVKAAKFRAESARIAYTMALGGRSPRILMSGGLNSFYSTQSTRGVGSPNTSLTQIGIDSFGVPVYAPFLRYSETEVTPFSDQFDRNLGKSIGFTLSLPLFNAWQVNTNIQKQRINQMSADLNKKQTELDVYKNVNQAYLDFQSAQKRYAASYDNFDANKESLSLAETQFTLGALNTTDYITVKNQYLQAETSLLQAKYELLFRRKVLDFYLGKPLY